MSNLLARILKWPTEFQAEDREGTRTHEKVFNASPSMGGPSGPGGPIIQGVDVAAQANDGTPMADFNVAGRKSSAWPNFLPGYGEKSVGSFTPCEICGRGTWVRYGGRALCAPCADRNARQTECVVTGVQDQ